MTYALWVIQVILALLFIFSGCAKFVMSAKDMAAGSIILPELLLRFIDLCEVLGGLGLVLPAMLRIRPGLTPLAAALLTIIMIGAVVITSAGLGVGAAVVPFITLLLCAFVAYGRWKLAPISPR